MQIDKLKRKKKEWPWTQVFSELSTSDRLSVSLVVRI